MQYLERVSLVEGKQPVLFVAPHGASCDDINTALIAEILATTTKSYAVINRGWERADKVDIMKDKANCNNIEHCHKDVVREEFLDPIIRFKNRILKKWSRCLIIYLHGMSNNVRIHTGISDLNYVIGYGRGMIPSFTCQKWIKDFVLYHLAIGDNCHVAEGKAGGKYAGYEKNNMNQLFRKWYFDEEVDSLQLEIVHSLRSKKQEAEATAQIISITIDELLMHTDEWTLPSDFRIVRI
jgi:hypothetical protein